MTAFDDPNYDPYFTASALPYIATPHDCVYRQQYVSERRRAMQVADRFEGEKRTPFLFGAAIFFSVVSFALVILDNFVW